jgi:hypothetical protein
MCTHYTDTLIYTHTPTYPTTPTHTPTPTLLRQVDGEPWMQPPCTVSLGHHGQSFMLRRSTTASDRIVTAIGNVLDRCTVRGYVSPEQRDLLLTEISQCKELQ